MTERTLQEELVVPPGENHVIYSPHIRIIPDTHGIPLSFVTEGHGASLVTIGLGDAIDAPKNIFKSSKTFQRQTRINELTDQLAKYGKIPGSPDIKNNADIVAHINEVEENFARHERAANAVNIRTNVEEWTDEIENGNHFILGNHELMALSGYYGNDTDLSQWLLDANKGKTTLTAFGIDTSDINVKFDEDTRVMETLPPATCEVIRQQIAESGLHNFLELLIRKGKMYMIANEILLVHAGVPVGTDGSLIPPQRGGQNLPGFSGVVGLDVLEQIERGIKEKDPDILHWMASGSSLAMSPAWVREPFFEIMRQDDLAKKVIDALSQQAKARGSAIKGIMIGHTEAVGGTKVGKYVFGTDTKVGDPVDLTIIDDTNNQIEIRSRHNFNTGDKRLMYYLTNPITQ